MPTGGRAELALQAVRMFLRQDHEPRELIVVDDGRDDLAQLLPDDPHIRHVRVPAGLSIGAKRNRGCEEARGAFIVQWDDDDWYGPQRLSSQVAPLIAGRAAVTALRMPVYLDLPRWGFWRVTESLHRRLFAHDVVGGTLAFARHVWERLARYPSTSLGEDAGLLRAALARGARLQRIDADGLFVYVRHDSNTWSFQCGSQLDPRGWEAVAEPPLPAEDRAFYRRATAPLVSAIMPTADRRPWVARAIAYFLRQDYAPRELIVLDDGRDRVGDLIPADPRIRYVALERRLVLGEKRNRACELARGEVIVHWDDDDWQAPHRLRYQVGELLARDAAVCGPGRLLFVDPAGARAWLYSGRGGARPWVAGSGLCYRRELWERNAFDRVAVGEDNRFIWGARAARPLVLDDHRFLVATVHARNSSRKLTTGPLWSPRPLGEVRALLGDDWSPHAQCVREPA
jgi:glycosyltransferase involved in cell wall biosynthesis